MSIEHGLWGQCGQSTRLRLKMVSANYMNFISFFYTTVLRFVEDLTEFNGLTKKNRAIVLERNMNSLGGLHGLFIVRELALDVNSEFHHLRANTD